MAVTSFHKKTRPAEHARNLFRLSEALLQDEHGISRGPTNSEQLRDEAQTCLKAYDPGMGTLTTSDVYDRLVSIYWR